MTTSIFIVSEYTLLRGEHPHSQCEGEKLFEKRQPSGRAISMALSYATGTVTARVEGIEIASDDVSELIKLDPFQDDAMSARCAQSILEPLMETRDSVRLLLNLVKYHLRHYDLHESLFSIKSERWGIDPQELHEVPRKLSFSAVNFSNQPLNDQAYEAIKSSLNAGVQPLVAMRHLHRAKHEKMPHHKWIDATIAAELAIKEALCRARPEIVPLLLEVPSPPLAKLYGSIMKTYLGVESPYRKKLSAGQEIRNALIHRPSSRLVERQEANDYVDVVEASIFHLLSLLYPSDILVRQGMIFLRHLKEPVQGNQRLRKL